MSGLAKYWRQIMVALLLGVAYVTGHQQGADSTEKTWKLRWSERDIAQAQLAARQEAESRAEEQRRRAEMEQVTQHAEQQLETLRGDAAAARRAAERLRHTVSQLQRNSTSTLPSACSTGTTGGATCGVLADVLAESVERNQQLAAEADRRRIAGITCEAAYNAIKGR